MLVSEKRRMFDLRIDVLNLICLLILYDSPDWSWTSIQFLVLNLGTSSDVVSSSFLIFWYSIFIQCQKQC